MESLAENLYLKQTETIPNLTEILKFFFRNRKIASKMLNFQRFLSRKEALGATFNETCALTSIKYVAEQGINVPNLLEIYKLIVFDDFSHAGDSSVVLKALEI